MSETTPESPQPQPLPSVNPESVKLHPLWKQLTDPQRTFVLEFLTNGNSTKAAEKAYVCTGPRVARSMAGKCTKNWRVQKILADAGGYKYEGVLLTRNELLQLMSDRMRDKRTSAGEFVKLAQDYVSLNGWEKRQQLAASKHTELEVATDDIHDAVMKLEQQRKALP